MCNFQYATKKELSPVRDELISIIIVNNYEDEEGYERQEYIHFNKKQNRYMWEEPSDGYHMLHEKEEWIKNNNYHGKLGDLYLRKKNCPHDPNKHSHSLYAEAAHEICQKYGFYL